MTTATASKTTALLAEVDEYSAHNYHPLPVVLDRGEGVWVWDVDGKRYMDMLSGYSALNQGHRHPAIVAAATEQLDKLTLTSRAFHNDQMGPFLKELCEATGFERALPMNTGAEAVETAIKAARKWGYLEKGVAPRDRAEIICLREQLPRTHHDHRGLFVGGAVPRRVRTVHSGLQAYPLRRCGCARGRNHGEYGGLPLRAVTGRGRGHRAAAGLHQSGA